MRKRILNNLELANYIFQRAKTEKITFKKDVFQFLEKNRDNEIFIWDCDREKEKEKWYEYIVKNIKI